MVNMSGYESDNMLRRLEEDVERATGMSADYLRATPLCRLRRDAEKIRGPLVVAGADIATVYAFGEPIHVLRAKY